MSHLDRPHRDKEYRHRESPSSNIYTEERSRKSYPSTGMSSQGTLYTEHSGSSTGFTDPYQKHPASTNGHVDSSSPFYPPKENSSDKCSNLCSTRGILQFVEITVNILVLICVGAAQASISGFTTMGGLGSFNIDSMYSPFEGVELKEARDLDMQYNQMRAPCVYGGVAFCLTMLCLTLLFLITGVKPVYRLSVRVLITECVFDILACLGYIAAVGLYLHFVIQINSTDVCKRRERLYARRGYTWMNCGVQGGDASVALFGLVAACLYFPSAVVCVFTIRRVQEFKREVAKTQYNLDKNYREEDHHKVYKVPENNPAARTFATLV
ncbi:MARVEL domain-containing protein 3-like [Hemicordylus capensis]|uniref:MARVEL domain-containing protein 3-like n=1 Tax=Hemicordylus capensis TaxID=884348 RepID=UPI002304AFA6|nr:MARVEL domain-containing protein 3-like [Hemicordylus capensis]